MKKQITALLTAISISLPLSAAFLPADAAGTEARQMEYLDRGTVAVKSGSGVFLSWRLLGTENYDTKFDVYRGTAKIASALDATNYTDNTAGASYTVVPAGEVSASGKAATVQPQQYITIPLDRPASGTSLDDSSEYTYSPNDVTPADVDGDGEYELILKWEPSNSFDSGKPANHSGNVYIDCYEMGGERLWRIDMGININAGQHFTQIAAYDFDLDGKAELAMKTAPGTIDGKGNYVSEASSLDEIQSTNNSADYRCTLSGADTGGRVLSGPEYYTVFQGDTGEALDTIFYPHPRGTIYEWGDNWGNRSERYLTAVAYLDGVTPSMIAWRGYYEKTTATAYNLVDKKLVEFADFNTDNHKYSDYIGQGNHNLTVGDVDGDGCDEILCGSLCLDNDLSVLWCSGRGHGDALHLGNYDPSHDGLEYFSVHEDYSGNEITGSTTGNNGSLRLGGMTLYAAEDGTEMFHVDGYDDTGRGMMANVSYSGGFFELWGSGEYASYGGSSVIEESYLPSSTNFRIFWDGDMYDELLDGTGSYERSFGIDSKDGRLQTLNNVISNNYTKNTPCLTADLFGDWREEIVARSSDNKNLIVYTTTIETENKLYTLMHDSAYRMQVACQNAGYNQPPHIGYYVDNDNSECDERKYAAYVTTVHNGETTSRTANRPEDKPDIHPTPMPTPAPESYFTIDDYGIITGYSGKYTELEIPETVNGITVTGIGDRVFYNNTVIKSVKMPDTVKTIGEYAFSDCEIISVKLSNGLESIGDHAFYNCYRLSSIEIPSSVKTIEDYAFCGAEALTSVTLNRGLETIGRCAFSSCEALKGIDLPDTLTSIGVQAFYYDTKLETIIVPDGVTVLNSGTFSYCTSLKSIVFGKNITEIAGTVFSNCTSLASVRFPDTLTSIGFNAFGHCTSLAEIELPDGLTTLGNQVFNDCTSLTKLTLPGTLSEIPANMAYKCTSLTNVEISEGVTSIGKQAFSYCAALSEITFPESLAGIGEMAFAYCSSLDRVTIMPTVTSIEDDAFYETAGNFTIYGYTNSQAYKYAKKNSVNFVAIGYIDRVIPTLPPMATCAPEDSVQITTNDATEITQTSAVLNGSITNSYFLDYYYIATDNEDDETLHQTRSYNDRSKADRAAWYIEVDDLRPSTTYIFYAFNYGTQTRGEIKSFTTLAAPKPTETPVPTEVPTPEPTAIPDPTDPPDPNNYPYKIVSCSMNSRPGYASVVARRYEKKDNAVMIFAVYGGGGTLISAQMKKITNNGGNAVLEYFPYSGGEFKVFIWDADTQEPYAEPFIYE